MAHRKVALDVTRLLTRLTRTTPNGIDRVDLAFARHYLLENSDGNCAIVLIPGSPRVLTAGQAAPLVRAIVDLWGEDDEAQTGNQLQRLKQALSAPEMPPILRLQDARPLVSRLPQAWRTLAALLRSAAALKGLPQDCVYLNISQFPVWRDASFDWMDQRQDVRSLFFLHDVLPLDYPEFFPARELKIHTGRLNTLSKRASGIIVSSPDVASAVERACVVRGLPARPIHIAPLFADDVFMSGDTSTRMAGAPGYFVACGTIEPRKNYLRLLHIWRALVSYYGDTCPRLLLLGGRGWNDQQFFDVLKRSETLRGKVMLISGLSSRSMRDVMRGAISLLAPSFVEGFGLPLLEAAALNVPVIASNKIPALDALVEGQGQRLDPIDGAGWLAAIKQQVEAADPVISPARLLHSRGAFFRRCDEIIESLL